jgi:hypothetical protein
MDWIYNRDSSYRRRTAQVHLIHAATSHLFAMSSPAQYNGSFPDTTFSPDVSKSMVPLYALVVRGFVLEHHKQFQEAVSAHQVAINLLEKLMPKIKKAMRKAHRVMFERQLDVLRERKAILDKAALADPPFVDFIAVPTILSADAELIAAAEQGHRLLSLVCTRSLSSILCVPSSIISTWTHGQSRNRMNRPYATLPRPCPVVWIARLTAVKHPITFSV